MIHVSRTLAEIRATATKAARGAGHDWGLAEEAGLATRVLESHDLPGVHVLARLVGPARAARAAQCGLRAMAALSDRLPFPTTRSPKARWRAPVARRALDPLRAGTGHAHTLRWDGAIIHVPPKAWSRRARSMPISRLGTVLEALPGRARCAPGPDWRSRILAAADWDVLERSPRGRWCPRPPPPGLGAGPADSLPRLKEPGQCR
jgi:hypothetical protein